MKINILTLSVFLFSAFALASEEVHFNSASVPHTPFKIKQAKAKGIELKPKPGIALVGKLSKPGGAGSFPAVVLLHSCFGIRPYQDRWATKLAKWGYVALQVDSFSSRGIKETCNEHSRTGSETSNVVDVQGALSYLRDQKFVDNDRVAVMGWGLSSVLRTVYREGQQRDYDEKFRAAIAFYPKCRELSSGDFYVPVMIHIGAIDDWMMVKDCEKIATASEPLPNPIELRVYPDTLHGFDDADVGQRRYYEKAMNKFKGKLGVTLGYSATSHRSAEEDVRAFLARHLK